MKQRHDISSCPRWTRAFSFAELKRMSGENPLTTRDVRAAKLFHCGTDSVFHQGCEWKKMASMTSLRPSDRVDSATIVKIFFRMAAPGDGGRSAISADGGAKNRLPSVHGEVAILPDLLKYPGESEFFSVYGGCSRRPARLPVVGEVRAIPQMLTMYCRITQSGTKDTSTTITNTEDRYAQSLV